MDWDDLRYVLAISRAGNLAAAGRALGVGHTTVGRRLATIERSLGARLFQRAPGGYAATDAGRRLIAEAGEVEARLDRVALELGGRDQRMEGSVRLTATGTFVAGFIVPALGDYRRRFPGIELDVVVDPAIKNLSRREADIGVRSQKPRHPNLIARKLCTIATAVYAAPSYLDGRPPPTPRRQFAGHTFVRFPRTWRLEEEWLDRHARRADTAVRLDSWLHVVAAVRSGVGLGLVECYLGDRDPGLVRITERPSFDETWWIVVHEDMRGNARVRATVDFLFEIARRRAAELAGAWHASR